MRDRFSSGTTQQVSFIYVFCSNLFQYVTCCVLFSENVDFDSFGSLVLYLK